MAKREVLNIKKRRHTYLIGKQWNIEKIPTKALSMLPYYKVQYKNFW